MLGVPGKRVPARTALRLQRAAEDAVGDPALGLDVARQMQGTALHALGYAWLASASLGEAFRRFARYNRVVTELWSVRIEESCRRRADHVRVPAGSDAPAGLAPRLARGRRGPAQPADLRRCVRAARGRAGARAARRRRAVRGMVPLADRVARAPGEPALPERGFRARAADRQPRGRGGDRARRARLSRAARSERHRHAGEAAHPREPALGRAVAGRRGARARAQPAHARPAARGGGNELHRDPRRDPPRARRAVPAAHRLLGRRGGLPRRVRGGVELQPRVPALDRARAGRRTGGRSEPLRRRPSRATPPCGSGRRGSCRSRPSRRSPAGSRTST